MSKLATALVCATLALFFAGCSGSDSNMLAPNAQPTEADVTSVVQEVVLPLLDGTADLATEEQSANLAPPPAVDGQTCNDLSDLCHNGGTAERCYEGNHSVWSYSECELSSGVANGSVTRNGGPFFGTTSFDIVVGELALDGAITWDWQGGCIVREYDGYSAVSPDHAVTIDGNVRCLLIDPAGELHLGVVSPEGTFSLHLDFDNGIGQADAVTDEGSYHCTIDMANGEADCNEI